MSIIDKANLNEQKKYMQSINRIQISPIPSLGKRLIQQEKSSTSNQSQYLNAIKNQSLTSSYYLPQQSLSSNINNQQRKLSKSNSLTLFNNSTNNYFSSVKHNQLFQNQQQSDQSRTFKKYESFRESKVQDFQKILSQNKNTQRIPFKQRSPDFSQIKVAKKGYNFYEPHYEQYHVKKTRHFWKQQFERFSQKRMPFQSSSSSTINNKEANHIQQKSHQPSQNNSLPNKFSQKSQIYPFNKISLLYFFIIVGVLWITLNLFFSN